MLLYYLSIYSTEAALPFSSRCLFQRPLQDLHHPLHQVGEEVSASFWRRQVSERVAAALVFEWFNCLICLLFILPFFIIGRTRLLLCCTTADVLTKRMVFRVVHPIHTSYYLRGPERSKIPWPTIHRSSVVIRWKNRE